MFRPILYKNKNNRSLTFIFASGLFLAFHYFLIVYINSTFLGNFASREFIGYLYIIGAIIDILLLLKINSLAKKIGFYKIMLFLATLEIGSLSVLATSNTPTLIFLAFVLHHATTPILLLCLNICIEDETLVESAGKTRGMFMTTISTAAMIAPMLGSMLFTMEDDVRIIYLMSSVFMFLFLLSILTNFRKINFGEYTTTNTKKSLKELLRNKDLSIITFAGILLQLIFSWFIIYLPIYLNQELDFALSDIGILISVTLIPFVLLKIPIGELSDQQYGEKEFLIFGTSISAIALIIFSLLDKKSILLWGLLVLSARIGASIMESAIETYFYKKAKGKDELISVFSLGSPIAYIVGPLLGSLLLTFLNIRYIFIVLGIILFISLPLLSQIKDTK